MKSSKWFVYIIENEKGFLYTGITTDLERRLSEHAGSKKGAKFFNTSAPKGLVYSKEFPNRSLASKTEAAIKKMSRKEKLILIEDSGE